MLRALCLFILLSSYSLCAGNIGLSGGELFLSRQKALDVLVMGLMTSGRRDFYQDRIIKNFGYSGIENLIRYREPALKDVFIRLLSSSNDYVRYKSLYAFRNTGIPDISLLLPFLRSTRVLTRDMCISTMTETDDPSVLNPLSRQMEKEKDPFIISSLEYALRRIKEHWKRVFPDFSYDTTMTNQPIQALYHKAGEKVDHYQERFSQIFLPEKDVKLAENFFPPVIDYEHELIGEGKRISFGAGGLLKHAGDDCAWFREGSSVYSIGDGIIRLVHHSLDWGFLMVIEHKLSETNYICSVYGHLSSEIYKRPGDTVKAGEKIGTIGLSYSVENGGYGAHLHFGISRGRWLRSKYDYAKSLVVSMNDKEQKVKEYRWTEKGLKLIFENGLTLDLEQGDSSLNQYLFWLKGYEFSRDLDRTWLDPQEFLQEHNPKQVK